jgi:hypothetical protein
MLINLLLLVSQPCCPVLLSCCPAVSAVPAFVVLAVAVSAVLLSCRPAVLVVFIGSCCLCGSCCLVLIVLSSWCPPARACWPVVWSVEVS